MKKLFIFFYLFIPLLSAAQAKLHAENFRPAFHFSPAINWCNDPNGLVYNNGVYNLFFQHNPFGNQWGHMTWAHATSKDLVHWKQLPIAIPEENGIMIFSGTCVVDKNNTSGFGKNGKIPMVAVYTGHIENVNQSQNIAYSLDDGVSWTKYAGNPVLDLHKKDFRDPKIFWEERKKYWVMCLMYPVEHLVQFYSSKNLKEWNHLSTFGPAGDTSGVWECPDLVQVPVAGMPGKIKWLLQTSQNASMQYFVGAFDGEKFISENTGDTILRPDYGPDYYAAITYNQLPLSVLPMGLGWINNWNYANDIPTDPWKGAMSLPRTLSVKKTAGKWVLMQKPVAALQSLRGKLIHIVDQQVLDNTILPVRSKQFELELTLEAATGSLSGIRIAKGAEHFFEVGYNSANQTFYIDRSQSGNTGFNDNFKKLSRFEKKITVENNKLHLHIYFDNSIAEIFINDGETVFTAQVFPDEKDNGIELFSNGGKSKFSGINLWEMKSSR